MSDAPAADGPAPRPQPGGTAAAEASAPRHRPVTVWLVCGLLVAFAAFGGLSAILFGLAIEGARSRGDHVPGVAWALPVTLAITALSYGTLAYFVFRGANWARFTGVGLAVLNVLVGLFVPLSTGAVPNCLGTLPHILVLVLLLRREVAEWCYPY